MATTEELPVEEAAPPASAPPETGEAPLFNLREIIQARKKGEISILDYAILTDIMERREDRREDRAWKRDQMRVSSSPSTSNSSSPQVEALQKQVETLTETVSALVESIRSKENAEAQEKFVDGVVKRTAGSILPEVQKLRERLESLETETASPEQPEAATSEITKLREDVIGIADKVGEKVGKANLSLADVDSLLDLLKKLEERFPKPAATGEVDAKTMAITTIGELGKEVIGAYRDIATSQGSSLEEAPATEPPAATMQKIIKRQVQNYITQRMTQGATTMNIQEAAKTLGLTIGQVSWAYQTLMKEGWFHVRVPSKQKKVKEPVVPKKGEETEEVTTETIDEEQVFTPTA